MVMWSKEPLRDTIESRIANYVSYNSWDFVIERAVTADSGNYTCRAWNYLGNNSKTANVVFQGKILIASIVCYDLYFSPQSVHIR